MKSDSPKIYFHSLESIHFLSSRKKIKAFLEVLFKKEKRELNELHYIFCSDDYLLKINQEHLQHDFYTDIITFDLSSTNETIGEVYISVDRLKENAQIYHTQFSNEALRLIFHGALHLCGYKDKKKSDKERMTQKENFYLKKFSTF
ncbi:MAG: rRNA maturation RNase YbeY [Bacteroidetes bacterium]|nr:rRNA maturation RNase YbeY [Bacteroidota bacterium]